MDEGHQTKREPLDRLKELSLRVKALEESKARMRRQLEGFRAAADQTHDCVTWLGPDGKFIYISPFCERITGYRGEEFISNPSLLLKVLHPEDRNTVLGHIQKGCGIRDPHHIDFRIFSKEGEERWISHYCGEVYANDGAYLGRRSSNRDITDRKRAEIELERVNRALKVLSECSKAMVRSSEEEKFLDDVCRIIVDIGGYRMAWVGRCEDDEYKSVRPVAEAGFERGYLESANVSWNPRTDRGRGPVGTAIRTGKSAVCKNMVTDPRFEPWRAEALKRGYASLLALPITVEGSTVAALNIYAAEPDAFDAKELELLEELAADLSYGITALRTKREHARAQEALKRAYDELELRVRERTDELTKANDALRERAQELERSNLELQRFAFVASHDLQEPLRKILLFGDLLQTRYVDALDDAGRHYLERIQSAASRMTALINGLLCHAQVTKTDLSFVPVSLTEVVADALDNLEALTKKTGGTVQVDDLPIVDAEPSQVVLLFQNLIDNALKFHSEKEPPVIRIYAEAKPGPGDLKSSRRPGAGLYEIRVEDNGIGFNEKHIELIFSPFQRLHGRTYDGAGIGLSICRKIAEAHGGTITATSVPGQGSTFIVTLPARSVAQKDYPHGDQSGL